MPGGSPEWGREHLPCSEYSLRVAVGASWSGCKAGKREATLVGTSMCKGRENLGNSSRFQRVRLEWSGWPGGTGPEAVPIM